MRDAEQQHLKDLRLTTQDVNDHKKNRLTKPMWLIPLWRGSNSLKETDLSKLYFVPHDYCLETWLRWTKQTPGNVLSSVFILA